MRTTVQPAAFGLIPTVDSLWQDLIVDNTNIHKEMIIEGVRYYATALYWLRIIQLKKVNSQPLTEAETMVSSMCDSTSFAVPTPLHLYLQALGTVKCKGTGQSLIPEFPPLPEHVIGAIGGYYGEMGEDTHNLYEEIPCLGVVSETLQHALGDAAAGNYHSVLEFDGQAVNRNLQGYAPLSIRRNEVKAPFINIGINHAEFPESVANTGFNYDIMHMVSQWISNTKTFEIEQIVFPMMTSIGSQSQTIVERPQVTGVTGAVRNAMGDSIATSLIRESKTTFGVAQYTLFQLMKEPARNAREDESMRSRSLRIIKSL